MTSTVSPEAYLVLRPLIATIYLFWATSWTMVFWHYGKASYASWLASDGRFRDILSDLASPVVWGLRNLVCRIRALSGTQFCSVPFPDHYSTGHVLRFAIFLGSISPMILGFSYFAMNRSGWDYWQITVGIVATAISSLSALAHLYIAYRNRAEAWAVWTAVMVGWLFLGPLLMYYFL